MDERIHKMTLAGVYPLYVQKVEKKGRTKEEVDAVIQWLTGFNIQEIESHVAARTTFPDFFTHAPAPNPARSLITGTICGVRLEDIEDPVVREVRYLDKLVDEIAKGRPMEKILRKASS